MVVAHAHVLRAKASARAYVAASGIAATQATAKVVAYGILQLPYTSQSTAWFHFNLADDVSTGIYVEIL